MLSYLALPLGIGAALNFGAAAVAQHHSTRRVRVRNVVNPKLVTDLARQPLWLLGVGLSLFGYLLQAAALHFGALAFVQPLLVTSLLFAVGFGLLLGRHHLDWTVAWGATCAVAGLAGFLIIARPRGGGTATPAHLAEAVPVAAVLVVAVVGSLLVAQFRPGPSRALLVALACGVVYGINAFLVKIVTNVLVQGPVALFTSWPLYAAIVAGAIGFLLNQRAFQASKVAAPVLAVITAADPLVSIVIARFWSGERFAAGAWRFPPELALLALMTAGIAALAYSMPSGADRRGT